ncbi:MAG: isopentenyl phosphate kinase [Candidatus Bathyarchaeota archaeon]|nr:isopentenyl phosphate kinase [Candidatus Bathyarchaeota archaeon]
MKSKPVILKLGGSVVTEKDKVLTPNLQAIQRLAEEISRAGVSPIVIVHGGGSYGHPIARTYKIAGGFTDQAQLIGFSKTHEAMVSLNKLLVKSLLGQGVPAFGLAPSSFIVTKKGRIQVFGKEPLTLAIKNGLIPVLYGDAVLDIDQVFAILSGDQIAASLAVKLNAERLIMGADVDGLYESDPKIDPSANLILHLTLGELQRLKDKIGGAGVPDVTGGMWGKVSELMSPVAHGVQTMIVNALKSGNIYKALRGEEVVGTRIEP